MLTTFAVVCEELSFSRAARRLYVSHPTVSDRIRRLERSLGVQLLERSTVHVAVTPAGRLLLERYLLLRDLWEETERDLHALADEDSPSARPFVGPLRVGVWHVGLVRLIPYLRGVPDVDGCVPSVHQGDTGLAAVLVAQGKIDVALVYTAVAPVVPPQHPGVRTDVILVERLHVALPAGHRLAGRSAVALADLAGESWIAPTDAVAREQQVAILRRAGFEPRIEHEVPDSETVDALIEAGVGIDITSPLVPCPPGVVVRPTQDPIDSAFLLHTPSSLSRRLREEVVDAVRRWYVDGLVTYGSEWLHHVRSPAAHPTLKAAAATADAATPDAVTAVAPTDDEPGARPTDAQPAEGGPADAGDPASAIPG